MMQEQRAQLVGISALVGGISGLLLAPIMVAVKYQTGWAIIPEPAWVNLFQRWLSPIFAFAPPTDLWSIYGMAYTASLLMMLPGLLVVIRCLLHDPRRRVRVAVSLLLGGYAMVMAGDAVHSLTWHQNGLTVPTPGTNPLANTAYAVHMMGMNLFMASSLYVGVIGLRRRLVARWLAWGLVLLFPSAVVASVTLLPTTPSGALWLLCVLMIVLGWRTTTRKTPPLAAVQHDRAPIHRAHPS